MTPFLRDPVNRTFLLTFTFIIATGIARQIAAWLAA